MDCNLKGFFGIVIPARILRDKHLTPTDKLVYSHIASYGKGFCLDSNEWMCERLDIGLRTLQRSLTKLHKDGYIFIANREWKYRKIYDVFEKPHKKRVLSKLEFSTGIFKNDKQG